ncbi:hypothetical protein CLAFUW4_10399 [Fulvia fulva]|uniref:Uncharacterized protein n=1 Tax=Passalora fulva TaxID=5499 RepID=A0A9Q8P7S8_PASFU|nr:uncharacterized protein CLAFUR5_05014 [Fulvia fulva]KAK4615550.1 hypothetical protein CLAFUR4_10403 [Fulvia fulva]KAK4616814.1 hypothetical protein CLAFUR0_10404 [Fulvia fulva]UJO16470.1 hypothetical protein CLAFUR5_05014 [Fulvia fulva]WPV19163.1 hypothetical protein CLAFUW4_10399 [Fulvia fulva]WPV34552.1 hypothetical protein CLAFUW7_10399 [Fulvia fulva]
MKEMIEDEGGQYPGGSLLEVTKDRARELSEVRPTLVVSPEAQVYADHLYEHVRAAFRSEKGDAALGVDTEASHRCAEVTAMPFMTQKSLSDAGWPLTDHASRRDMVGAFAMARNTKSRTC